MQEPQFQRAAFANIVKFESSCELFKILVEFDLSIDRIRGKFLLVFI